MDKIDVASTTSLVRGPEPPRKRKRKPFTGWRCGILSGTLFVALVLALNIFVVVRFRAISASRGISAPNTIFQGNCDKARKINVITHLVINTLSTILLAASNYAMQCLIAPTRPEINIAHAKKFWLDIGVASFRNIGHISRRRLALWCLLVATSLPLHLLYNSAVYSSVSSNDYIAFLVDERGNSSMKFGDFDQAPVFQKMNNEFKAGNLQKLTPDECINAYATQVQTRWGHVAVVVEHKENRTAPVFGISANRLKQIMSTNGISNPAFWICGSTEDIITNTKTKPCLSMVQKIDRNNWSLLDSKVQYCLAEPRPENCNIRYSPPIAYVVIACNFLKVLILSVAFLVVVDNPIATIGDAVMSFLCSQDASTMGYCLMSRDRIGQWSDAYAPQTFHLRQGRLRHSASQRRWCLSMFLYVAVIGICLSLFIHGMTSNTNATASQQMGLALGAITPATFIGGNGWAVPSSGNAGLILNVLVANSPQLILSTIYYTYNGLFTCFNIAKEWSQFTKHRIGLRVSEAPQGQQRSTYFLSLPYRYALPLMLLSLLLHWLCSQSIFLVSVQSDTIAMDAPYNSFNWTDPDQITSKRRIPDEVAYLDMFGGANQVYTCGYSAKALLFTIVAGIVMVLLAWLMGQRKLQGCSIPMSSTCSASISAMCHLPDGEDGEGAAFSRLQWGDVGLFGGFAHAIEYKGDCDDDKDDYDDGDGLNAGVVRHCGFSSKNVSEPVEGYLYA